MDLNVSGIYQIRNKINGKIYIGQSKNVQKRICIHKNKYSGCRYLSNAIKYYGWENFEVSILEQIDDLSKLTKREQYWLDKLRAYNQDTGYNICHFARSSRGIKPSDEARAKMSISKTGKKKSNEHVAKAAASHYKKINQIDEVTGEIIYTWKSLTEASSALKIDASSISMCCRHRRRLAGGYAWRYIGDNSEIRTNNRFKRKINQIDIVTGKVIHTWNSIVEAAKFLSINKDSICKCCKHKLKTSGGYIWQYVEIDK